MIRRRFNTEDGAEHPKVISIQSTRNRGGESEGVSCIQNDGLENLGVNLEFPVIWNSGVEKQRFQWFVNACRFGETSSNVFIGGGIVSEVDSKVFNKISFRDKRTDGGRGSVGAIGALTGFGAYGFEVEESN